MNPKLFSAALKTDQRFDATIERQFPGKTRWTITKEEMLHPEIELAYRAKIEADRAWLDSMHEEEPKGMSVEEGKAHLAERAKEGACGLSWEEIEQKQGGKLTRP